VVGALVDGGGGGEGVGGVSGSVRHGFWFGR
jgi:hypothetical protein